MGTLPFSADRYKLLPITSIPSSSNGLETPQPGCIYVDSVNEEYIAYIYDGEYKSVVIAGPSTQFDENAKRHKKKLYLVEEANNIILYHYDGKQWDSISRPKAAVLEVLKGLEYEEGENDYPPVIQIITSFYGCRLLKGKLEGLTLTKLDAPGLKSAIIEQIAGDMSRSRKRPRDPAVIANHESPHKREKVDTSTSTRRCLEAEFQKAVDSDPGKRDSGIDIFASLPVIGPEQFADFCPLDGIIDLTDGDQPISPLQLGNSMQTIHSEPSPLNNGDTLCTARVSDGLGPAQCRFNFWETRLTVNSHTEIDFSAQNPAVENPPAAEENAVGELIARVERGDTTAYCQYAALLQTGSGGVEKDEGLATYFFELAAEAEDQQMIKGRWSPAL